MNIIGLIFAIFPFVVAFIFAILYILGLALRFRDDHVMRLDRIDYVLLFVILIVIFLCVLKGIGIY